MSAFVRAPLPRIAELLTSLVSDVSTDLWGQALDWRLAREARSDRALRSARDFVVIIALSVGVAWCTNRGAV